MKLKLSCIIISITLTGCSHFKQPVPDDPNFAPVPIEKMRRPKADDGSIYQANYGMNLFETIRARHVGDILTVQLVERTQATKKASTKERKTTDLSIANPNILGRAVALGAGYNLGFDLDSDGNFQGQGESKQDNQLSGTIAVTVVDVQPNGNLVIRGEKWLTLNQGNEFIRLSGIIRPYDLNEDNSIRSDKVANARISYSGTGQVANSNIMGWFSKILWGVLSPF